MTSTFASTSLACSLRARPITEQPTASVRLDTSVSIAARPHSQRADETATDFASAGNLRRSHTDTQLALDQLHLRGAPNNYHYLQSSSCSRIVILVPCISRQQPIYLISETEPSTIVLETDRHLLSLRLVSSRTTILVPCISRQQFTHLISENRVP